MLDGVAAGVDVLLALARPCRLDHRDAQREPLRRESQYRRSHFDLVAFGEGTGLGERRSVDGRGINATRMQNEFAILRTQLRMIARNGRLANEDMACGVAPDRQQRVPDRVGAALEFVY